MSGAPEFNGGQYVIDFEETQRLEVSLWKDRFKVTYNGMVIGEPNCGKVPVALLRRLPMLTESELWHRHADIQQRQIWEKLALQTMLFDSMHDLLKAVAANSVERNALGIEDFERLNRVLAVIEKREVKHAAIPKG